MKRNNYTHSTCIKKREMYIFAEITEFLKIQYICELLKKISKIPQIMKRYLKYNSILKT